MKEIIELIKIIADRAYYEVPYTHLIDQVEQKIIDLKINEKVPLNDK